MAELGLGTVQFGLDYGISNPEGQTPPEEVASILKIAASSGIRVIDTAHLYGESETVLGKVLQAIGASGFRVITKTPGYRKERLSDGDARRLTDAFQESLRKLGLRCAEGLLVHWAEDLLTPGGDRLYGEMAALKRNGQVNKIGASFYSPDQVDRLLQRFDFDLVQIPVSILNQDFVTRGHLKKLKDRGIEIHTRSAFVQGLLCMSPPELPDYFSPILPKLEHLDQFLKENELSRVQGALCFLNQQPEIDVIVLGINNSEQLRSNVRDLERVRKLSLDFSPFAVEDGKMTNPSTWPYQFRKHDQHLRSR